MIRSHKKVEQKRLLVCSIFSFILFYLLSFATGGGLFLLSAWLLYASDIRATYGIPTIAIVILLLGSAFLLYQLVCSLFHLYRADSKTLKELSSKEMPELFGMINDVAAFMKVEPPQKVYLSSSVSASVFLSTSSTLFFSPHKKKLEIGVGLINILTMEELKAVIAHEMGHFSQRSMFLGGYVYSIEQAVYFMNKQTNFKKKGRWEQQVKGLFGIFHILAQLLFCKLNRRFKEFSMEMEYDADRLAVECVGAATLKSALLKVSFASVIYEDTVTILGNWAIHGKRVSDIYSAHRYTMDAYLSVFGKGERFTDCLWVKPHALLAPSISCRLRRLEKCIPATSSTGQSAREYIPALGAFSTFFTGQIYREIYRKDAERLDECHLFTYRKWIGDYYVWLADQKCEAQEYTLQIDLPAKLHRLPLLDAKLELHVDKKQIGVGSFKKGITLSVPITPGEHTVSITCWTECYMNEAIVVTDNDSIKSIKLDYKPELAKGRYLFFIVGDR